MKKAKFHSLLRKAVLEAIDIDHIKLQHCKKISIEIFSREKNYISESSIKRFFGFVPGTNPPSPFVLDSLSQFAGFSGWHEFMQIALADQEKKDRSRTARNSPSRSDSGQALNDRQVVSTRST